MTFDKIYTDITEQVIPKIAEGVVITKDYAFDLFGRYIKYLILTDIFYAILYLITFIISVIIFIKIHKWHNKKVEEGYYKYYTNGPLFFTYAFGIIPFIFFGLFIESSIDLIKDLTVPEIRIYEIYNLNK